MARAARQTLEADVGIGITGVAGPDTVEDKPVGTVHIGLDVEGVGPQTIGYQFAQGREAIKRRAVTTALAMLRRALLERQSTQ
jgi:nicotinamide-nucleotide amidase